MNTNIKEFTRKLGKRIDDHPSEPTDMTLSSEMAHELYHYLINAETKERIAKEYNTPTALDIASKLHEWIEAPDGHDVDRHTLVWAEYWLRYAVAHRNEDLLEI